MNDQLINIFGMIFLCAGFIRIYLTKETTQEMLNVNLPIFFKYFIIISEILIGSLLLSNISVRYKIFALNILFYSIIFFTFLILLNNYEKVINTFSDLWTFQPNALSIWYHLLYALIFYLICNYKLTKK